MNVRALTTALALLAVLSLTAACGGKSYVVAGTDRAVGTDGTIEMGEADGTYRVTVELKHLPPANRLGANFKTYVVWFIPKDSSPVKAGTLAYDADDRVGKLVATTPNPKLEVRVTAEKNAQAAAPSEVAVVSKQVSI